jgi:predicted O-linked N-acetylglucosamine transferase (SPINDLY family)
MSLKPLVIYPQYHLRRRMAANFFTTMELHTVEPQVASQLCCVANSASNYISKALRLGKDEAYRQKVSYA